MNKCTTCGSYAINHRSHGRAKGKFLDLCDVCYWREEYQSLQDSSLKERDVLAERNYQLRLQNSTLLEALNNAARSMWHSESNMDNEADEAEAVIRAYNPVTRGKI